MPEAKVNLTFDVTARRVDAKESIVLCKSATVRLDTDLVGSPGTFSPAVGANCRFLRAEAQVPQHSGAR